MVTDFDLQVAHAVFLEEIAGNIQFIAEQGFWLIVIGFCCGITAGCLLWMQVLRGKGSKNIW